MGVIEETHSLEKRFTVKGGKGLSIRFFDEKVKVIRHHAVGDDSHAVKGFELPHEGDKVLFLCFLKNEASIDDTGQTVVIADPFAFDP
jgi:hypothetical protein